jgi:acetyl esterase/lipase
MRRLLARISGTLSLIGGLLIIVRRFDDRLWRFQVLLSEMNWITVLLGPIGWRGGGVSRAFGALGALLASVPFFRWRRADRDMHQMMQDALGVDYEAAIPAPVRAILTRHRWHWRDALGQAYRTTHGVRVEHDRVYMTTPLRHLHLDVYRPAGAPLVGSRYPAVITVHGGGWDRGNKGGYFRVHHRHLAAQGYVVFDLQYQFTSVDGALWPAQLENMRQAIQWVKDEADTYQIDPDRIALYGRSAGGHMALCAAYDPDLSVRAVVTAYAPIDLRYRAWRQEPRVVSLLQGYTHEVPAVYAEASPIEYARDDLPATLVMHGFMDELVTPLHAEMLHTRLQMTNTPAVILRVPWGRHGFDAVYPGLGAQLTRYYVDRFLAWSLYNG